jgi:hypothetical protein
MAQQVLSGVVLLRVNNIRLIELPERIVSQADKRKMGINGFARRSEILQQLL